MADYEFYPVGVSSSEAAAAIRAASGMAKTAGLIRSNGTGEVAAAQAGIDYGYPVLLGDGPPTQFVAGELGQFYYNRAAASAPYMYVCVDYTSQGYQWQVLGAGGSGFVILGYYDTLELMQSSVTNPAAGDAYGVGTAEPYTIYVFDGITHTWKDNGTLGVGGVTNGIPPHGTTGQALLKRSNASGDLIWGDVGTADGSVTAAKLAEKAVTETKYADASIPARAYKSGTIPRSALANDALYSPFVQVGSRNLTVSDVGKSFFGSWGENVTFTVTAANSAAIPSGAEMAFFNWGRPTTETKVQFADDIKVYMAGETNYVTNAAVKVAEVYGMIAIKKIYDNAWLVTGNVEVVT